MATMETDRLVDDYLGRLEKAAAHMQRSRRAELVAEIRGHIETALREEEAAGEVAVRNVLERLGPPEEIVDAAEPDRLPPLRTGKLEFAALLALVFPFIGWLGGIALVLVSKAWTNRDKAVGIALALLPALAFLSLALGRSRLGELEQHPRGRALRRDHHRRLAKRHLPGLGGWGEKRRRRVTPSIVA